MSISEMKDLILAELEVELSGDSMYDENMLSVKIDSAIREVKSARNYPTSYTQEMIDEDMERFYTNIKRIALYDYNQIGIEGQSMSSENGESRTFVNRESLFHGVIPLAY